MFKIGDKVRCIDNTDVEKYLTKGKIYEVITAGENFCIVTDTGDYFSNKRFELVGNKETKKKMKFVPMTELEVISVNGIDGILIPE